MRKSVSGEKRQKDRLKRVNGLIFKIRLRQLAGYDHNLIISTNLLLPVHLKVGIIFHILVANHSGQIQPLGACPPFPPLD
jgi:hypothetical protein